MRIKKIYQGELPENKILNVQSESSTDTYSCDYINNLGVGGGDALDELPIGSVIRYDGEDIPEGWEEVEDNSNNVYSTEEQMIGTYLGKPLYRRVFMFNEKIGGNEEGYIDIETNINPDEIELIWIDHSASFMYNIENSYNLTGGLSGLAISTGIILKKFIRIFCNTEWNTSWTKVISVLYTKTTD